MDKCRYKNLLRDSAKLISNSQYTNQNTAYLPLDVYTCYDLFYPPTITMSGASKLSSYNRYSLTGTPYSTQNMLPSGPTASTTNSVWNTSNSGATLEYYLPHSFASGYTGKFRSSVYRWDDTARGFVYPPVHERVFSSYPKTTDLRCSATTTSSTYSVFFSISAITDGPAEAPTWISPPSFYWFGKNIARTESGGFSLLQHDDFSTAGTISNYLQSVRITTGGSLTYNQSTGTTHRFNGALTVDPDPAVSNDITSYAPRFVTPNKNGHIIPIPNPTTGALNITNDGVTGNGGYWHNDQCYMSGMTYDFTIGAGNGYGFTGLTLTGAPRFVSATTDYHGYYTGFATGNVYVYSACCQHKLIDTVPPQSLTSRKAPNSPENSNDYLVKTSFIYSGDGTTASCYLTSGNTYDTLIDNPSDSGYEGLVSTLYQHNLYYSGTDHTFIAITNPQIPAIIDLPYTKTPYDAASLGIATGTTTGGMGYNVDSKIELAVESLPVSSSGQSQYYLSQEPVGDISLTLNGVALLKDFEFIKDQRKVTITVDKTVANTVNIKTSDELVATYIKGSSVDGFVSETETVPSSIVTGGTMVNSLWNSFRYNSGKTTYEYYANQPIVRSNDLSNLVVLINGVRLTPNKEYYRSKLNSKLIIFDSTITLYEGDIINIFYVTNLKGINSESLTSEYKEILWSLPRTPKTSSGYFEIQTTLSGDTTFASATTRTVVRHSPNKTQYRAKIGPFNKINERYLYRIVNYKTYVSVSGSTLITTASSLTNKFDTFNPALKSY